MIQIRGQNRIKLLPKEFCLSRGCSSVEHIVGQNEICKKVDSSRYFCYYYNDFGSNK